MICPKCFAEYREGITACADCGVPLVKGQAMDAEKFQDSETVRVYSSSLLPLVHNVKNLLDADGIESYITNEYLGAAVGEIPPIECWPQLWVRKADSQRAMEIINRIGENGQSAGWVCSKCGEQIESQFSECWNCGTEK